MAKTDRGEPLTKISIIYIQLLQEEKIFPIMPRSFQRSLKYTKMLRNLSEKSEQHGYPMVKIACLDDPSINVLY